MAAVVSLAAILPQSLPAAAASERALYLYYTHTKETARIVFKRNGQYVQSGINELNRFLRDWRRNEPAKMDPRLFDLVWEVYQEVGATQPIHIVSAYRSPATNAMLRASSSGVAENSQHTRGNAMDFYIPGVPLNRLRAVAMKKQVGGVGYYPNSGSPFVHLDTGNVRAWPRMTTAQLKELFPDGRTLHVPTNGRPLSQEGYKLAQAEWQRCHQVPCGGGSSGTAVAGSGRTLMDLFTGGGNASRQASAPVAVAAATQSAPAASASAPSASASSGSRVAPVPAMRPDVQLAAATAAAPVPAAAPQSNEPEMVPFSTVGSAPLTPEELTVASLAPIPAIKPATLRQVTDGETAVMAIAALDAPVPAPRLHMTDPSDERETILTAYAAPAAERALENLIASDTTEVAVAPRPTVPAPDTRPGLISAATLRTASLGGLPSAPAPVPAPDIFEATFSAVEGQPQARSLAEALANLVGNDRPAAGIAAREVELVAPDLDHVAQVMALPGPVSSAHYAVIFEHDQADFDPATELGRHVTVMGIGDFPPIPTSNRFQPASLTLASR
ncbi:DUF882 domain-containing protein [Devosia geojensis]|uniref:DUF882 domain-containing protein n=1 Tax=Devosia geojensis TaxID=443610 RepID=UPI000697C291|nr:DUF882 domain-containing protein [Devosia geojensis]